MEIKINFVKILQNKQMFDSIYLFLEKNNLQSMIKKI